MNSNLPTRFLSAVLLIAWASCVPCFGQIREGGIDPANLGKGDWIYYISMATNRLGGNVSAVTNENSLMLFYKSMGVRYIIVKAATSDQLFYGSYNFPQFTSNFVNIAHAHGLWVLGYNRSYGSNVLGEIAISDYVFRQGADGFVFDAEAEWEQNQTWIGDQGPAKAWQLCSAVRSNWPTKFLAHAPFPIISYHSSFPYKEFGYWCDAVMPQIYPAGWSGVKSRPSGGIDWTDVNFRNWQNALVGSNSLVNGQMVYWTNAIKPLAPVNHAYGPNPPNSGVSEIPAEFVMEFIDYLNVDPHSQSPGGYRGASFWRADLHGAGQWANLARSTIGTVTGVVNNLVMDDTAGVTVGSAWTPVRTFYNGASFGNGTGTDLNSFGTNYSVKAAGDGSGHMEFRPRVLFTANYHVYEWHPYLTNASTSAPIEIVHGKGTNIVYANQTTNAGRWSWLGRFYFIEGTNGVIRIRDNVGGGNTVAIADGIKLSYAIPTNAPVAPNGLWADAVSSWEAALSWNDNSDDEAGFTIGRATLPGGPYIDIPVPANTTNYFDANLNPDTIYYYVIRATNVAGSSANSPQVQARTLPIIPEAPQILTHPESLSALPGQAVVFSVEVSGSLPLAYQWSWNGAPVPGATSSQLLIPAVEASHVGLYSVTVTNVYGNASGGPAALALVPLGAWGDNEFWQSFVPAAATNMVAVAAGAWHSLALATNGSLTAWGNNFQGQCDVPDDLTNTVAIAAGGYHSLALRADGRLAAWGANDHGQCSVPAELESVLAIAAGGNHSLALRVDGTVVAWGDNSQNQRSVPTGLTNVVAIAAGARHSLALTADGQVVAWGSNLDPDGIDVGQSRVPLNLHNVVGIAAGEAHSLALKNNGTVDAWGDPSSGQCTVPSGLTGVVALAAGGEHSLALKSDGTVAAWGADWDGQCSVPTALTNAIAISAGTRHSLGLVAGATPALRLLRPNLAHGRFSAVAQNLFRSQYTLRYTDSLSNTNWQTLSTLPGNGALLLFTDPQPPATSRYYRLESD